MLALILIIATQVDITTTIHPKYKNQTLTIGDPFEITVSVKHPLGITVSEPFADSLEPFMILEQTSKIVKEKGSVLTTYDMKIAAFNTGEMEIPIFQVVHAHGDTMDTIASKASPITIESVLPENMTDINDLKKAVEFPNFLPLIIAGIIIGVGIIGYIAYRSIRTFLRARTAETPPLLPWIEALAAIDTIPIQEWFSKGWIKKYYYALSEILKRYIERRFAFNAAEQTTSEIVAAMKQRQTPLRDKFHEFFRRADLVKYAKIIPPEDEIHAAAQNAKDLVNQTTPQESEETQ